MHNLEIRQDCAVKTYRTDYAFGKELAALRAVYGFGLGTSPRVIWADAEQLKIKMSLLPGVSLDKTEITAEIAADIARKLAFLHLSSACEAFGSFSEDLQPEERFRNFAAFLKRQMLKWKKRLEKITGEHDGKISFLEQQFGRLRPGFEKEVSPLFCHNDLDLNNIMVDGGRVSGFIDWEYVGAYSLSWELRKLIPVICWDKPVLEDAFKEAYLAVRPEGFFPDSRQQAFLVALDCIGWLSWVISIKDKQKTKEVERRLEKAMARLAE